MDEARQTFATEAEELLQQMEDALLSLEDNPDDLETFNSVFRAMHTIKGAAGIFGFDPIVEFTHPVETVLDAIRSGERPLEAALITCLLDCKDHTATLVDFVLTSDDLTALPEELKQAGERLLEQIGQSASRELAPAAGQTVNSSHDEGRSDTDENRSDNWIISLQFKADALRNGLDPLSFIRYLQTLGTIEDILTVTSSLPEAEEMEPESCYLGFRIAFNSSADKAAIEAVFEFAQEDCDIRILPPNSKQQHYLEILEQMPESEVHQLGEMLLEIGAITEHELESSLQLQSTSKQSVAADVDSEIEGERRRPIGEILVEQKVVSKPIVEQALKKQEKAREQARHIRVDSAKLGQLINLVGELVISSAAMRLLVERHQLGDVDEVVSGMEHLVEEIRDHALELRMVQIGETFSRFRRVVRDVSQDLGKRIELQITGGESELDKTVVEKINDPLTHLVRNSLDHGIELPQERKAKGKPEVGTLSLNAYHDSGHIVIEVKDDGAGLDPDKIRAKAEAIGLVKPDQSLSRAEIFRLIFEAGLSTKQQASNLSGRGVGMDVVRRNIEALRGSVDIDSELGMGTTITIQLPLTLAIIDGFMVGAGGENYVIPLSMVEECVEMESDEWQIDPNRQYINLRGEVMPYMRLRHFFGEGDNARRVKRESLVVVRFGRVKAGFVVDTLFGELQTVIKPLGKVFQYLQGVSGATVLGSGEIALILDVQGLVTLAHARGQRYQQRPKGGSGGHLSIN
ncbi:chemotaxis protein CheA [Ectothiorhodospiraceae bacterium BW-2]|nr:chemotaxis protein CheA [Ectothiorhodospiraceae bacterium BW-2]